MLAHNVLVNAAGAADTSRIAYAADLTAGLRGVTLQGLGYAGQLAHSRLATRSGQLVLDSLHVAHQGATPTTSTRLWLPRLTLDSLQIAAFQHKRRLQAAVLRLEAPQLVGPLPTTPAQPLYQLLPPYLRQVALRSLRVRAGSIRVIGSKFAPTVAQLNLQATDVQVDAAGARDPQRQAYARA